MFELRKEMGLVVRGSLSKGLEMRLDPSVPIEELRAGKFVVIEGEHYEFFSMITDIALASMNADVLDTPPDRPQSLLRQVIAGTSTFGTVTLRPMIMLRRDAASEEAVEETLLPVKSIPGHFSAVMEATEADVARVFGSEA